MTAGGDGMDDRQIARWRMRTMRLVGGPYPNPTAVVGGLLGVQAEVHRQAAWAVASRAEPIVTEEEFGTLFDDGAILRTHVLRSTWHYVLPDDIRWLQELTEPRIRRVYRQHMRELGITDEEAEQAGSIIAEALAVDGHLTRTQIGERLGADGLPSAGQGLMVVLAAAELAGLICSGRMQGKDHTYALIQERAPQARRLDRDEALAEIVLRYFRGHGPATERDLSYWATLTLTDIRAGLAEVADQLHRFEHGGKTYWAGGEPPDEEELSPRAHLLLLLDEYHNGVQDSRGVLDVEGLVPKGRAANYGMALVDGQMVGGVRRTTPNAAVRFEVNLFRELDDDELAALHEAADRCGAFVGAPATLSFTRRGAPD